MISVANTAGNILSKKDIQINIGVNLFSKRVLCFDVMSRPEQFVLSEETDVTINDGTLTKQEGEWLESVGILRVRSFNTESGEVSDALLDLSALARIAFEYDLLRSVASRVEIDILEAFRSSSENTLTTSEIAEETGRPKSSISRALSQLVEKNKLTKVQAGVYRYPQ